MMDGALPIEQEAGGDAASTCTSELSIRNCPTSPAERIVADTVARQKVEEFDWTNDAAIVQHEQPSLAVYLNIKDQVVIRQERDFDEEYDPVVRIALNNAANVATAILKAAGIEHVTAATRSRRPARSASSRSGEDLFQGGGR